MEMLWTDLEVGNIIKYDEKYKLICGGYDGTFKIIRIDVMESYLRIEVDDNILPPFCVDIMYSGVGKASGRKVFEIVSLGND